VAKWRKLNPERNLELHAEYRKSHKQHISEYASRFRIENPEKMKQRQQDYYAENSERVCVYGKKYREENKEKTKGWARRWWLLNKDKARTYVQNRRAKTRGDKDLLSLGIIKKLYEQQNGLCACCGQELGDNYHLDHIMPLALGGEHSDSNVQLLKARCNLQKGAKHPEVFMRERQATL